MTRQLISVDAVITSDGVVGDQILIENGSVTSSGFNLTAPGAEIETRSGYVVAGLRDAHLHLASLSASDAGLSLTKAKDRAEVMSLLAASANGDVVATGFDETDHGRLLTRYELDEIFPDRAALVYRVCGHIASANSVALDRADVSSVDPAGGSFDRGPDGRPTGVMRETAIDVVTAMISGEQRAVSNDELLAATHRLAALGLTTIDAMIPAGTAAWCGPEDELARLVELDSLLPLSINGILISNCSDDLRSHAATMTGCAQLRFAGWKGFSDGSLGGHTAALRAPYSDAGGQGTDRMDTRQFCDLAESSLELGGEVCIHAIGDAAVSNVLDFFATLIAAGAPAERLRVEHASVMPPDLISRFADLGVAASVQPAFVASDSRWLEQRLGTERARSAYPFRSMLDAGIPLLGGSDAPVESPDPLTGIRAAVDRAGWHTTESLEPTEALSIYADGAISDGSISGGAILVNRDLKGFQLLI